MRCGVSTLKEDHLMDKNARIYLGRWSVRTALATFVAALLVIGATWQGLAADRHSGAQAAAAPPATSLTHAVAGGRDSYADVVKVVAPAVVTIRTQGTAKVSPTD